MVYFAIDANHHFLSFRLGRYEFFAQRKASPFYCIPWINGDGAEPSFWRASGYGEHILVMPFFALHLIKHGQ